MFVTGSFSTATKSDCAWPNAPCSRSPPGVLRVAAGSHQPSAIEIENICDVFGDSAFELSHLGASNCFEWSPPSFPCHPSSTARDTPPACAACQWEAAQAARVMERQRDPLPILQDLAQHWCSTVSKLGGYQQLRPLSEPPGAGSRAASIFRDDFSLLGVEFASPLLLFLGHQWIPQRVQFRRGVRCLRRQFNANPWRCALDCTSSAYSAETESNCCNVATPGNSRTRRKAAPWMTPWRDCSSFSPRLQG